MNRRPRKRPDHEMQQECDFSRGERGKYAARFAEGSNVVVLAPDVGQVFTDSEMVNEALRMLMKIARQRPKQESA